MSWWTKNRRHVIAGVGAVAAAATAWFTGGATVGLYAAAMAGMMGASAAGAIEGGYAARDAQKEAASASAEAERAAASGEVAETETASTVTDTAGNEAYKRKQKQLAASNTAGRGGTMAASTNLGGSGKLG